LAFFFHLLTSFTYFILLFHILNSFSLHFPFTYLIGNNRICLFHTILTISGGGGGESPRAALPKGWDTSKGEKGKFFNGERVRLQRLQ